MKILNRLEDGPRQVDEVNSRPIRVRTFEERSNEDGPLEFLSGSPWHHITDGLSANPYQFGRPTDCRVLDL